MADSERLGIDGSRSGPLRATLDAPESDAVVVACPPHPRMGGDRRDPRLRVLADALAERGVACLRFDYGPWDEGRGERRDARDALAWAGRRHDPVGLFGYSFGGWVALGAAGAAGAAPAAVSVLAPAATVAGEAVADTPEGVPVQVVGGTEDDRVDWERVAATVADSPDGSVERVPAGHGFRGTQTRVAGLAAGFLAGSSN
jgi:hypothetical protein